MRREHKTASREARIAKYLRGQIARKKFLGEVGGETFQVIWDNLAQTVDKLAKDRSFVSGIQLVEEEVIPPMGIANSFVIWNFPFGFAAGPIVWVRKFDNDVWLFPIVLTSPGYGVVGKVGKIAVDMSLGQVIGCTPREIVIQRGTKLEKKYHKKLLDAFLKARSA